MIDETEDNPDIKKATRCILNFMLLRLSSANNNSNESNKKWLRSIPCDCRLLRDSKRPSPRNKYAAKRKLFGGNNMFNILYFFLGETFDLCVYIVNNCILIMIY